MKNLFDTRVFPRPDDLSFSAANNLPFIGGKTEACLGIFSESDKLLSYNETHCSLYTIPKSLEINLLVLFDSIAASMRLS